MNDEITDLRQWCIDRINTAPEKTLRMVAHLLETSPDKAGGKLSTTLTFGNTKIIKEDFLAHDSNTLYGLIGCLWQQLMLQPNIKLSMRIKTIKNTPWYKGSKAKRELDKLCINGCGNDRMGTSEYCSEICLKSFSKWMKSQQERGEKSASKCIHYKVNRFRRYRELPKGRRESHTVRM